MCIRAFRPCRRYVEGTMQYQGWGGQGPKPPQYNAQYNAQAPYGGVSNRSPGMFAQRSWGDATPSWGGYQGGQTATAAAPPVSWGGYANRGLGTAPRAEGGTGSTVIENAAPPAAPQGVANAAPQSAVQQGLPSQALAAALSPEGPYAASPANTGNNI